MEDLLRMFDPRPPEETAPRAAARNVVVVGAGYGGLSAALALGRALRRRADYRVVLIDRNPYHELKPKLPEAVGEWTDCAVQVPIAELVEGSGVDFVQASATGLDVVAHRVRTDAGELPYWRLVLALGGQADLAPGGRPIPGLAEVAVTPYGRGQACRLRHHLREMVEHGAGLASAQERRPSLTVVVAGGGFVGVEMAGELADRLAELARRYGLDGDEPRVVLLERGPRLLGIEPGFDARVLAALRSRGVDVRLGVGLEKAEPDRVALSDGTTIQTGTVVWAGGLRGHPLAAAVGLPTDAKGRVHVDASLRVVGPPDLYVLGDTARCAALDARPELAASAQAAVDQADVVARAVLAEIHGRDLPVYHPRSRGVAVLLGHRAATARLGRWTVPRWIASWLKQVPTVEHLWRLGGPRLALRHWGSTVLPLIAPERVARHTLAGDAPGSSR